MEVKKTWTETEEGGMQKKLQIRKKEKTNRHDYLDDRERDELLSMRKVLIMLLLEMGAFRKESWYLEDY